MKKRIILALFIILYCISAASVYAFRCGPDGRSIAREGMHKYEILNDCGPPESREFVGVDRRGGSYRVVEEWIYIIEDRGYKQMYLIKFNGKGIAAEVEWLGEQR